MQHDHVRKIRKAYTTNRRKWKLIETDMNLNCGNGEKLIQGVKDKQISTARVVRSNSECVHVKQER